MGCIRIYIVWLLDVDVRSFLLVEKEYVWNREKKLYFDYSL